MTRRRLACFFVLVITAWGGWCAWTVLQAHHDIQAGRTLMRQVQAVGAEGLLDGEGRAQLEEAQQHFAAAGNRLGQPALAPLRAAPFVGRQLDSSSALADAVTGALGASQTALDELDVLLARDVPAGPARPALLRDVADVAATLDGRLADLDLGPDEALIGRLADARAEFSGDLEEMRATLASTQQISAGLATMLEGPGRWLLLAANSAEMQNGSGMYLSWAPLDVTGGSFDVGDVQPLAEFEEGPAVALDPDQAARWPWMDPNVDIRHLGTSARFDATAATAVRLVESAGHGHFDGVIAVDPFALRALLMMTGPVDVDGTSVTAEGVVAELLHDQYATLVGATTSAAGDEATIARRDRLGAVARGALEAFSTLDHVERDGIEILVDAAHGRHLMAWSADPAVQTAFSEADIAGELPQNGVLLSVANRGGNKLDWFLGVDARLTFTPDPAGDLVEVHATLSNEAVLGPEPTYVVGPYPGSGLSAGDYLGIATLTVPGGSTEVSAAGAQPLVEGPDGDHQVLGVPVRLAAGGQAEVVFTFRLPPDVHEIDILPAARAQFTRWTVGPDSFEDIEPRPLSWTE